MILFDFSIYFKNKVDVKSAYQWNSIGFYPPLLVFTPSLLRSGFGLLFVCVRILLDFGENPKKIGVIAIICQNLWNSTDDVCTTLETEELCNGYTLTEVNTKVATKPLYKKPYQFFIDFLFF